MTTAETQDPLAQLPAPSRRSRDDRMAGGKKLRQTCSRRSSAGWNPSARRRHPVELLIENSRGRLEDLVPLRYGRMMASPFVFYRGAAAVMAYDLSSTPVTGLRLQVCGDCHLLNFGGFGTPERRIVFDINDFDETAVGPWEWDVKRLATSFIIAARSNGFSSVDCRETAWLCAQSYRQSLLEIARADVLKAWYSAIDMDQMIANSELGGFYRKKVQAARVESSREIDFAKLADVQGSKVRIKDQRPLIFHMRGAQQQRLHREALQRSPTTEVRFRWSVASCSIAISWSMRLTRSSEWGVSACFAGSRSSCRRTAIPCSCSSRKPGRRCWNRTPAGAHFRTMASAWWWASESCRRPVTSFLAG